MELVDRRNTATLLPIIQQHVQPGTVVHSDEWVVYSQISSAGYTHSTVNHSLHFVDPITGPTHSTSKAIGPELNQRSRKCMGLQIITYQNILTNICGGSGMVGLGKKHMKV